MTDLPLTLQMEIDISVRAHKLEIAESFAKLRAMLLPNLPPPAYKETEALYFGAMIEWHYSRPNRVWGTR